MFGTSIFLYTYYTKVPQSFSFIICYMYYMSVANTKIFLLQFVTMALTNKLGGLLKKATSSNPSIYQAIRCMSSSKLFVGGSGLWIIYMLICLLLNLFLLLHFFLMPVKCCSGLSYGTDDHSLRDAFANYGQVIEGTIPFALFVALFFFAAPVFALLFADHICFNLSS